MKKLASIILLACALGLIFVTLVLAQSNSFSIPWWTIESDGGESVGGIYALHSDIGQSQANQASRGGGFTLVGSIWDEAGTETSLFLPIVRK